MQSVLGLYNEHYRFTLVTVIYTTVQVARLLQDA
jgi:hypothetical protein